MPTFLREYGVIIVLMIVALSGYFLVGDRRDELVDYTLDMLGTRLVELASGEEEKAQVARQFAEFSDRVERQEVSQEAVESVAANVLNLRARGAIITPEEAELMLFQESDAGLPSPSDSIRMAPSVYAVSSNPDAVAGMDLRELGQRMTVMFELADAYESTRDTTAPWLQFSRDERGIHVLIDPEMPPIPQTRGIRKLAEEMSEKDWVRWQDNLAEQQMRSAQLFEKQAMRVALLDSTLEWRLEQDQAQRFDAIKRIQNLAMLGATTDLDTLVFKREMESFFRGFDLKVDAAVETSRGVGATVRVVTRPDSTEG